MAPNPAEPIPKPLEILIMGAGISGLTSVLALSHPHNLPPSTPPPNITIAEVRPTPSTIGGAVNLTPNALRHLDHLGVYSIILKHNYGAECRVIDLFDLYTGQRISGIDFSGPDGNGIGRSDGTEGSEYFSRRIIRHELQSALLEAVGKLPNVKILWGRKCTRISETGDNVTLHFAEDPAHSPLTAALLIGCDGIHSAARTLLVEPTRKQTYTGIAVAMAFADLTSTSSTTTPLPLPWHTTALASSRQGSFMASYYEPTRTKQYVCAVMETPEVRDREGWKVKSAAEQERMRADILGRFKSEAMPICAELVGRVGKDGWVLYPVYELGAGGRWVSDGQTAKDNGDGHADDDGKGESGGGGGRCILLGDAAHAMPPQGESTGLCIEDSIVFARCLLHHYHQHSSARDSQSLHPVFDNYQSLRRARIDASYAEAKWRWETVKDSGWLAHKVKMWVMPWFIWFGEGKRARGFGEDFWEI